jgi:secondary thiamine-phosphate synthase enzyme
MAATSAAALRARARSARVRISDITAEVAELVRRSDVSDGICVVRTTVATCAVRVNECESGFFSDFESLLERLVPLEDRGAVSRGRCISMLLGPSGEVIPVRDGDLCLGAWQRVLLVELDGGPDHPRPWHVAVLGAT